MYVYMHQERVNNREVPLYCYTPQSPCYLGTPTIRQPSLSTQFSELSNVNTTHSVQIQ
jgi:hypothetical protein